MDARELVSVLTTENVKYILEKLGSRYIDRSDAGHIIFQTICHHGNKHKLYYYIETKKFHCYTNCGQIDIYDVVMQAKGISFKEALDYICSVLGITKSYSYKQYNENISDDMDILSNYETLYEDKDIESLPIYDDVVMKLFSDTYYSGWIDDGISIETMKKFNIKYYSLQEAIVIPHYDAEGRLVGIRRRTLNQSEVESGIKYMPMMIEGKWYTHPLQFNLYGLHINKDWIIKTRKVIIVESEKGVMQVDTMFPNGFPVVALSSSNLSNRQVDMILELGVDEVIFALDRQYEEPYTEEYKKYQEKIMKLAKKFLPYVNVSVMWDTVGLIGYKDSPTDRGIEVFEKLYETRITLST